MPTAEDEVGAATPEVLTARGAPAPRRTEEDRGSPGGCPARRGAATPLLLLSILLLLSGNALGQQPQRQSKQPTAEKKPMRPGRAKTVTDLFNTTSCADPPYRCPYPRIEFYLYTRSTQEEPEKLDLLEDAGPALMDTHFDAAHPTKVVIHGFGGGRKLSPSPDMRKAYFTRGEYNVIVVDYSSLVVVPCLSQVEWGPRFCALCIAQLIGWLDDAWRWSIGSLVAANRVTRQVAAARPGRWRHFNPSPDYHDDGEAEPSAPAEDGNFGQKVIQSVGRAAGGARVGGGGPRGGGTRGGDGATRGGDGGARGNKSGGARVGDNGVIREADGRVKGGNNGVIRGADGRARGSDNEGIRGADGRVRGGNNGVIRGADGRVRGGNNGVIRGADGRARGSDNGVIRGADGRAREGDNGGVGGADGGAREGSEEGAKRLSGDGRESGNGERELITATPRRLRLVGTPPVGVHVIGYSVGAHIAGLLANYVGERKIGRITGLDPTIIFYMGNNRSKDLDPSDAHFVDVIHTGAGVLGQWGPNGHVDFYVNGGTSQPGCTGGIYETLACDHQKVTPYFIESITTQRGFWATPCSNLLLYLIGWCTSAEESKLIQMGEDVPHSARGIYYLETNARKPYAKGLPSDSNRRKRQGRG